MNKSPPNKTLLYKALYYRTHNYNIRSLLVLELVHLVAYYFVAYISTKNRYFGSFLPKNEGEVAQVRRYAALEESFEAVLTVQ